MNATRLTRGATSFSSSTHLQRKFDVRESGRVAAGTREALDKVLADGIGHHRENDRNCARLLKQRLRHRRAPGQDRVRLLRDKLFCQRPHPFGIAGRAAKVDLQIAPFAPAQLLHGLLEGRDDRLGFRIVRSEVEKHADAADVILLLGMRRKRPRKRPSNRPRGRRADNGLDEFSPAHSGTPATCRQNIAERPARK